MVFDAIKMAKFKRKTERDYRPRDRQERKRQAERQTESRQRMKRENRRYDKQKTKNEEKETDRAETFSEFVGCLISQQDASVSQGSICYHTETEVAEQTGYLTQSRYTDTGPTSSRVDPRTPGTWQSSH